MAVITMNESRARAALRSPKVPIGVPMTDISCVLLLLLGFHGIAGIGLALAVFEALMLWWGLNARSVQLHRVTIAQRFFAIPTLQTGEISVSHVVVWSLMMSICSPLNWLIDCFVSVTEFTKRSTKAPTSLTSTSNHYLTHTPFVSTDSCISFALRNLTFNSAGSPCQDERVNIWTVAPSRGERS